MSYLCYNNLLLNELFYWGKLTKDQRSLSENLNQALYFKSCNGNKNRRALGFIALKSENLASPVGNYHKALFLLHWQKIRDISNFSLTWKP